MRCEARLANADQITKLSSGHFHATSDHAREHGSHQTDQPKHAKELATLPLATMLL